MSSTIHIGSIIRDELRRQGKTNAWFAKEINVNTRTINKIFLKGVIDTHQLLLISQALGVDFFKYYSEQL
ncbi:MAG: XRE family transcriptional regulator [Paludibacteraceae bacterium]|nr:XRE family transcriptional regulator [Paludibacteraceae bacterium]MBR6686475.1 XRE family transcriptional regulator [Paludibacteraceae bacterium]